MGPQPRQISHRFSIISDLDSLTAAAKERLMSGSGSVSGSPGRLQDNISRDSGIGCLKVSSQSSPLSYMDVGSPGELPATISLLTNKDEKEVKLEVPIKSY